MTDFFMVGAVYANGAAKIQVPLSPRGGSRTSLKEAKGGVRRVAENEVEIVGSRASGEPRLPGSLTGTTHKGERL